MKKIIAALLTLIMVASLCACASKHEPKFNGIWTDGTTTSALELNDDGTAVLRLSNEVYKFTWAAEDYDTIVLSIEVEEGTEPQFAPDFEKLAADEEATEEITEEPVAEATEEPTDETTEESTGEATDEEKEPEAGQTTFNVQKVKVDMMKVTLSVRKGVMYLVVEEVNQDGIYYYDFTHLLEGVQFNNIEYEYFPELSKQLKSIAFVKKY